MSLRKPKRTKSKLEPADRQRALERVAKLASELCDAIDAQSEDVGGYRRTDDILAEIGPLCDKLEGR